MTRARRFVGLACLLLISALIYAPYLDYAPAQLGWDEVFFGLNAHSIATTGHDIHGRFLPLYFQLEGAVWYQPMIVYATAVIFTLLPVAESTLRLPSVLVALVDIALMYFVAREFFKNESLAFIAAALLALTPVHFLLGRIAVDYIFPLPFLLFWLLCLIAFVNRPRPWLIAAGTAALGVGFYSYMASVVLMPFYWVLTILMVAVTDAQPKRRYVVETLAFFLPLLILVPWLYAHPHVYTDQITRYRVYDAKRFGPLQGVKEFLNYQNLDHRVWMYWGYFSPNFLFMSGAAKMTMTTRRVGVFLMPLGVFLPFGVYRMLTSRRDWPGRLLVFGVFSAPAAALIVDDPGAVDREMNLVPFAILLATFGVSCLLQSPRWRIRIMAVCLLALVPLEFAYFDRDYFGEYRVRSAEYFERNIRGGVEDIVAREDRARPTAVYLNVEILDVERYWRFYLIKHDRSDLLPVTVVFNPTVLDVVSVAAGSLLLCPMQDAWQQEHVKSGDLRILTEIREPDGKPTFVVLQRVQAPG